MVSGMSFELGLHGVGFAGGVGRHLRKVSAKGVVGIEKLDSDKYEIEHGNQKAHLVPRPRPLRFPLSQS